MTSHPHDTHHRSRNRLSRRRFIETGASLGTVLAVGRLSPARSAPPAGDLAGSAVRIAQMIRDRQVTALEVVRQCLARIEAVNPKLNALVTVCRERALAEAAEADAALARGQSKGPLHGVPFTVSDAFDSEGVVSTGGTLGRKQFIPGRDATVVARARAAGAILLGKSNVSELAMTGTTPSTTNLVCGVTHSPFDIRSDALGGSGGAGAIIAAGGAFFDIATDDDGAVRVPCAANGLAGLKPTLGRLPRTGHIVGYGGAFNAFTELGPVARRVEDLALLLPILSGQDGADATLAPVPFGDPAKISLGSLRVAHWSQQGGDATQQALIERCAAHFRTGGAKVSAASPPLMAESATLRAQYRAGDGHAYLRRMLQKYGTAETSPELPLGEASIPSPEFSRICEELDAAKSAQLAWVESFDLLVWPATLAAPTGWPSGVIRVESTGASLPAAVQLVAQPWREDVLLAAMLHLEKQTGGFVPPAIPGVA